MDVDATSDAATASVRILPFLVHFCLHASSRPATPLVPHVMLAPTPVLPRISTPLALASALLTWRKHAFHPRIATSLSLWYAGRVIDTHLALLPPP